jgi:enoyl-CoA hydratase
MTPSQTDPILVERSADAVAVLRIDRAPFLNALDKPAALQLSNAIDTLAADSTLRVVIITGVDRGFCAGLDLTRPFTETAATSAAEPPSVADFYAFQELFAGLVQRLRALDKVVIAAVNGVAAGAGFGLSLAADIRIASTAAAFHVGAVKIGLTAGECGISYHLPRLIGASRAFEVMLTGRPIPAEEASRIGLVSSVVEPGALMDKAFELAAQVVRNSPYATLHTKKLMWANLDCNSLAAALELENRAQVLALLTDDFREATLAFSQKRPPVFTGR